MELKQFLNFLRGMRNIDRWELVGARILDKDDLSGWKSFSDAPHIWLTKANDDQAAALWKILQDRFTRPSYLKSYRVLKQRVLGGTVYAEVGDIVHDQKGHDYGLASDDTHAFGVEHVSVTKNEFGGYPGFTIPKQDLEEINNG